MLIKNRICNPCLERVSVFHFLESEKKTGLGSRFTANYDLLIDRKMSLLLHIKLES